MVADPTTPEDPSLMDPFGINPVPTRARPLAGKRYYTACELSCPSSRSLVSRHRDFLAFQGAAATDDPE